MFERIEKIGKYADFVERNGLIERASSFRAIQWESALLT
tara:strand:- start:395 stop:511 length:117 start_codon:yes stop_codon:yes gene_type:complete